MTRKKLFWVLMIPIVASVYFVQHAYAAGEEFYWQGNDEIQAKGGIFGPGIKFSPDTKAISGSSARMVTGSQPQAINFNGRSTDSSKNGPCTTVVPDLKVNDLPRPSAELRINVDNNTVTEAHITGYMNVGDGNDVSTALRRIAQDGTYWVTCRSDNVAPNTTISNKRGGDAVADQQANATKDQIDKAREAYIKQQCGDPKPGDKAYEDCADRSKVVFNTTYDSCKKNTTDPNAIKQCLEQNGITTFNAQAVLDSAIQLKEFKPEPSSCSLKLLGFIICPVTRFMAFITDAAFYGVKALMTISPLDPRQPSGQSLHRAWTSMLNFANICFILAFLVIIFSQLTSIGLTNYGIKRLLPRLIIAAVLVNISFHICVIAVDLSNILGNSLYHVLTGMDVGTQPSYSPDGDAAKDNVGPWTKVVTGILVPAAGVGILAAGAVAGVVFGAFALLVPIIIGACIALIVALLMLIARYALIIILITIAPLAFVAYLLPNTQKWFSKWLSSFTVLLALFPVMSVIFGGSTLAAKIINDSAVNTPGAFTGVSLQIVSLGVQAIPLAITPLIVKFGGGMLNRFGGRVRSFAPFKAMRDAGDTYTARAKKAQEFRALQRTGGDKRSGLLGMRDGWIQRKYRKQATRGRLQSQLNKERAAYISNYISPDNQAVGGRMTAASRIRQGRDWVRDGYHGTKTDTETQTVGQKYAEGLGVGKDPNSTKRAAAFAINMQHSALQDMVKSSIKSMENLSPDDLAEFIKNKGEKGKPNASEAEMLAALQLLGQSGKSYHINDVAMSTGDMTRHQRNAFVEMAAKNSEAGFYEHPEVQHAILSGAVGGQADFDKYVVQPNIDDGYISAASIVRLGSDETNGSRAGSCSTVLRVANAEPNGSSGRTYVKQAATEALRNDRTRDSIPADRQQTIIDMSKISP